MQNVITADELLETSDVSLVVSPVLVFNLGKYKSQKWNKDVKSEWKAKTWEPLRSSVTSSLSLILYSQSQKRLEVHFHFVSKKRFIFKDRTRSLVGHTSSFTGTSRSCCNRLNRCQNHDASRAKHFNLTTTQRRRVPGETLQCETTGRVHRLDYIYLQICSR